MRSDMRTHSLVLCVAAALSACSAATHVNEDCAAPGDEDSNGLADCDDSACEDVPACQPECGNGRLEAGEGCDDGNAVSGDGCDGNCTPTACGNAIQSGGEA